MAVIVHRGRVGVTRLLSPVLSGLTRKGVEHEVHDAGEAPRFGAGGAGRPDLVVSVGGDGTTLAAARAVAGTPIPLLAINRGGLGFLAAAEGNELRAAVEAALEGGCETDLRRTLRATVVTRKGAGRPLGLAVNDAVLRQGDSLRALRAELELDGRSLGVLLADGLVVATSTGSTAYSLSAGGPLLLDETDALVATPVCAHTLYSRPLVFGAGHTLAARVLSREVGAALSLDGLPGVEVRPGEEVRFALARETVRFLRLPGRGVARALRHKLGWQGTGFKRSP